jgi:hypothetical protein
VSFKKAAPQTATVLSVTGAVKSPSQAKGQSKSLCVLPATLRGPARLRGTQTHIAYSAVSLCCPETRSTRKEKGRAAAHNTIFLCSPHRSPRHVNGRRARCLLCSPSQERILHDRPFLLYVAFSAKKKRTVKIHSLFFFLLYSYPICSNLKVFRQGRQKPSATACQTQQTAFELWTGLSLSLPVKSKRPWLVVQSCWARRGSHCGVYCVLHVSVFGDLAQQAQSQCDGQWCCGATAFGRLCC